MTVKLLFLIREVMGSIIMPQCGHSDSLGVFPYSNHTQPQIQTSYKTLLIMVFSYAVPSATFCTCRILRCLVRIFVVVLCVVVILCVFVVLCVYCCLLSCVYCCSCLVCTVVILCVFAVLCVYSCFFFTLDDGLLVSSQYSEGPATGHLDTGFSWFSCI